MTVTPARTTDRSTRRERLRTALLGDRPPLVTRERRQRSAWRTESYGPLGLGTHRDPRWHDRTARTARRPR